MRFGIHTLDDFDLSGKTVLGRIDINQPVDRETATLKSTARISACVPTLREITDAGAKLVLLAHQGSDIEYENFYTTAPHAVVLSELLGKQVGFVEDVCGPTARQAIQSMQAGDIILLDNVRFCSEEQTLFELKLRLTHQQQAQTEVVRKLAPLADLYVCDAFAAAHRDQPSLCGFEMLLPSAMGRLFEREYCVISELMQAPARPCVFILGGSKVSDAFLMMETVLQSGAADKVLAGGLVGHILLLAKGFDIGSETTALIKKKGYYDFVEKSKPLIATFADRILLPTDLAYLDASGARAETSAASVPSNASVLDIGSQTAHTFAAEILAAETAFANGPMGVFERPETQLGTKAVWQALGDTSAHTVIGGGDSITAAQKYHVMDKISYVCTGGGALIRFLTGEELPVVKALRTAASR